MFAKVDVPTEGLRILVLFHVSGDRPEGACSGVCVLKLCLLNSSLFRPHILLAASFCLQKFSSL